MSVIMTVLPIGSAKAKRAMKRLAEFDSRKLLDTIGQTVENQTLRRIKKQEGPPEGGAWKKYTPGYRNWKASKGKLQGRGKGFLRLTGSLVEAMGHVVGSNEVAIGTSVKHGIYANAERPFLGLTSQDRDDVESTTVVWFAKLMGIRV